MSDKKTISIAVLYPGDHKTRQTANPYNNRFSNVFKALAEVGFKVEPAVYHDDFREEVKQQLLLVDGVLVWFNPLQGGGNRIALDSMLKEIASAGIFVSTHPDIIQMMGTKEILYQTRDMEWGCDTHLYNSYAELCQKLPVLLDRKDVRVIKQNRGNGGDGVWKVELADPDHSPSAVAAPNHLFKKRVRVRQAKKGSVEENMELGQFLSRCKTYFINSGKVIDQVYQPRVNEGMMRCYLVQDKVVGFGHQAVNALYHSPPGIPLNEIPEPGPRLYHSPVMPEGQLLKRKLEQEWVPALKRLLNIETSKLPVLWDADFILGAENKSREETYVLCEINVSSVAPFPDSALPFIAQATLNQIKAANRKGL